MVSVSPIKKGIFCREQKLETSSVCYCYLWKQSALLCTFWGLPGPSEGFFMLLHTSSPTGQQESFVCVKKAVQKIIAISLVCVLGTIYTIIQTTPSHKENDQCQEMQMSPSQEQLARTEFHGWCLQSVAASSSFAKHDLHAYTLPPPLSSSDGFM